MTSPIGPYSLQSQRRGSILLLLCHLLQLQAKGTERHLVPFAISPPFPCHGPGLGTCFVLPSSHSVFVISSLVRGWWPCLLCTLIFCTPRVSSRPPAVFLCNRERLRSRQRASRWLGFEELSLHMVVVLLRFWISP